MSGVEYIGFLISLLALVYLFFLKRMREGETSPLITEEKEEGEPLQEFLKALEREKERRATENKYPPAVQSVDIRSVKKRPAHAEKAKRPAQQAASLEKPIEEMHVKSLSPRSKILMQRLPKLADMIVFQEIMGKPRGFKPYE